MTTFLLIIIYLSFISLGLPDSLLGSAWPIMRIDLHMPLSAAGIISMIITGGTIVSSFLSGRLIKRFGTGNVTFISVLITAVSLFGFSFLGSYYWLCVLALPLGLGAGAVDAALNNFVALNYKAKHMSWLHCFWGIGATTGPLLLSRFLLEEGGWKKGYFTISVIQICLVFVLFLTLPFWKIFKEASTAHSEEEHQDSEKQKLFTIPGIKVTLLSFFCYCGLELTTGLWGSSYLVASRGISVDTAAAYISLFYAGITLGRFIAGFIAIKINNTMLIRIGEFILFLGVAVILLPLPPYYCMLGFILIGMGCAPIYPCMLHETPKRFGKHLSQSLMGIQMAFAYIGSTIMPPLFGFLASALGTSIFPYFILIFLLIMIVCVEIISRKQGAASIQIQK